MTNRKAEIIFPRFLLHQKKCPSMERLNSVIKCEFGCREEKEICVKTVKILMKMKKRKSSELIFRSNNVLNLLPYLPPPLRREANLAGGCSIEETSDVI